MNLVAEYMVLVRGLLDARAASGGELSQDEESDRAEALEDLWFKMTDEQQAVVETQIELAKNTVRNKNSRR